MKSGTIEKDYPLMLEKLFGKIKISFWKGAILLTIFYLFFGWIFLYSTNLISAFS